MFLMETYIPLSQVHPYNYENYETAWFSTRFKSTHFNLSQYTFQRHHVGIVRQKERVRLLSIFFICFQITLLDDEGCCSKISLECGRSYKFIKYFGIRFTLFFKEN